MGSYEERARRVMEGKEGVESFAKGVWGLGGVISPGPGFGSHFTSIEPFIMDKFVGTRIATKGLSLQSITCTLPYSSDSAFTILFFLGEGDLESWLELIWLLG